MVRIHVVDYDLGICRVLAVRPCAIIANWLITSRRLEGFPTVAKLLTNAPHHYLIDRPYDESHGGE